MPRGFRNTDGALTGSAAYIAQLGAAPAWLVDPSPNVKYGDAEKVELLARLAEGETLTAICNDDRMPSRRTVYGWACADPVFADAFDHARRLQATSLVDKALDAADGAKDKDSAMAGRVKAETYLKVAALLDPGRYAPKQPVGRVASITINTNLGAAGQAEAPDGSYTITLTPDDDPPSQPGRGTPDAG